MLYENEVIMMALGIGVFIFAAANKAMLERIPEYRLLLFAYCLLLPAWVFTILEGFFFGKIFNFIEHLLYALSALLLAGWCWKITYGKKERCNDGNHPF